MAQGQSKLFDIHFEIGLNPPPTSDFYAKVQLGNNGVIFEQDGSSPATAIAKIAIDMEQSGMWAIIAKNPGLSSPSVGGTPSTGGPSTGGAPSTKSPTETKVDPNAPKKRPSDITQIPHPDCQVVCQAYDNFGVVKCKNICAQRSDL